MTQSSPTDFLISQCKSADRLWHARLLADLTVALEPNSH
jgi:hypothetical protein